MGQQTLPIHFTPEQGLVEGIAAAILANGHNVKYINFHNVKQGHGQEPHRLNRMQLQLLRGRV
jgi:hypothetical protein